MHTGDERKACEGVIPRGGGVEFVADCTKPYVSSDPKGESIGQNARHTCGKLHHTILVSGCCTENP